MGGTLSLNSIIEELKSMQPELRKIGEYRKANMLDFAIGYLNQSKKAEIGLKDVKNLNDINGESTEGKLLIATLGRLSTQPGYSNREVDSILKEMAKVAESFN